MLTFFGIVFALYGLINYYIIRRGLSIVSPEHKTFFLAVSIFVVLSYIAGRFLERAFPSIIGTVLIWIGSFWIAFMFYFFLSLVALDLLRLINHFVPFFPEIISKNPEKTKRFTALVIILFVFITVAGGYINTKMIVVQHYRIPVKKSAGNLKSLNIAMASDIHLGTILDSSFLEKVVDKINALNPDIVLLPGDIIDEDIGPVLRDNMGHLLESIKSKYGVYAVTGNHEYIGGADAACNYLTAHGIKMLRDSVVKIDNDFYVIGREDRSIRQFSNKRRKDLKELLNGVDTSLPLILMDHQPFGLNDAFDNGIDLQLSGHTHNGQLWPMNFLISKIYELDWGYMIKGNTHYYVSCGVGGWGPPIRTGSRPEIVNIKLVFKGKQK
ncbi:MAG: metallophosphoesterase [Bacteroidetes bacterium]|nr:metallophosphoesterase [Bacteroidota bacterium]